MGVIIRQSVKNSVVNYLGAFLGILSTLLIYPLDSAIYGYAQFLYSTAFFIVPFASFGINSLILRYYPVFRNPENRDNGFFGLTLGVGLVGFLFLLLLFFLFKSQFLIGLENLKLDQTKIENNLSSLLVLSFFLFLIGFFTNHIANQKRIVVPNLLQNFLFKIFLPIAVFLHYKKFINGNEFTTAYLLFYLSLVVIIGFYMISISKVKLIPNFSFINKSLKTEMFSYLSYSALNSIGYQLVYRIDVIMVAMILGFSDTGSYGIFLVLTIFLDIPTRSILQISSPIISSSWQDNEVKNIQSIYSKSSLVLLIVGLLLFCCAWLNIDEIVSLSTNTSKLSPFKYVFFYLGIAKLVEMATSVNSQIIMYSKHYRYNLIFILITAVLAVILNYILINKYGVVGAAMATCLTLCFVNTLKVIFIQFAFKMQPFSFKSLLALVICLISFYLIGLIALDYNPIINLVIRSGLFSILFILPIWFLKLSPDINNFVLKTVKTYLN